MLAGADPSARPAVEIEAQPVVRGASHTPFERGHPPPSKKDAVVHIGAEGEVPDFLVRPAVQRQTPGAVPEPRERPYAEDDRKPEAFEEAPQLDHQGRSSSREMRSSSTTCRMAAGTAAMKTVPRETSETRPAPASGKSAAGDAIALK